MGDGSRFLIAGLGNPGREYKNNRHNLGFMVIDQLAQQHAIEMGRVQSQAIVGTGNIAGASVILAKPQTYMNDSGRAIGALARFYKIDPDHLFVAYDELDLPEGAVRLRPKGGAGGHNGMKSVIQHVGQSFPRLRIGIGRPPGRMPAHAYVLQDFGSDDTWVEEVIDASAAAVALYISEGIDAAMTRFNGQVGSPT